MFSKDGKLFGKISIVDIVAVIVIVVALWAFYTRFFVANEKVETVSSKIQYEMKVSEVRIGTFDALNDFKGPIYDSATKEYIGEIVDVTRSDATKVVTLGNGQMVLSGAPERYDLTVTVQLNGKVNDSGYYTANNHAIAAGSSFIFTSKAVKTTGVVLDVYELSK